MRPGISTDGLSVAVAAASMLQGGSAFGAERNLFVDVAPSVAAAEARAASQLDRIKKRATVKEVRVVRVETTFLSDSKEAIRLNVFEGSADCSGLSPSIIKAENISCNLHWKDGG